MINPSIILKSSSILSIERGLTSQQDESSGLQLHASTSQTMTLDKWNATEDEGTATKAEQEIQVCH